MELKLKLAAFGDAMTIIDWVGYQHDLTEQEMKALAEEAREDAQERT